MLVPTLIKKFQVVVPDIRSKTLNSVSLLELSVQVSVTLEPETDVVRADGEEGRLPLPPLLEAATLNPAETVTGEQVEVKQARSV